MKSTREDGREKATGQVAARPPGWSYLKGSVLSILVIGAISWAAIALYATSPPRGQSAGTTVFSAARAMRHVQVIARTAHPTGSVENAEVRDYLLKELRALGFSVVVDRRVVARWDNGARVAVENVLARKQGTGNTRALLFCAHYDSARFAPGAGDDGAAVAALLETLRVLQAGPALRNDLIVLMTDGEEMGLLGVRGFVTEHPWAKALGLVCNFDARGNRGSSIMFETSSGSAELIREFARGVPQVIATSLATVVYERMPNGTDFAVFKRAGIPSLNFAFIEGVENYHQPTDTPSNLSPATLQHTGDTMLHLARHFGNAELPVRGGEDAIYFNAIGHWFVHYPVSWGEILGVLIAVLAVFGIVLLKRARKIRFGRVALGVALVGAGLVVAGASGWGVLLLTDPQSRFFNVPSGYCWAGIAVSLAVASVFSWNLLRWISALEQTVAVAVLWTALAVVTAFSLPGGSYIFAWPALAGCLGLLGWSRLRKERGATPGYSRGNYAALRVGSWCAVVLVSPLSALLWTALPLTLPGITVLAALSSWPLFANTGRAG